MANDCVNEFDGFNFKNTLFRDSSVYKCSNDETIGSWQGYSGGVLQNGYFKSGKLMHSDIKCKDGVTQVASKSENEVKTMKNISNSFRDIDDLHNEYCPAAYEFSSPQSKSDGTRTPNLSNGYSPSSSEPNERRTAKTSFPVTEYFETYDTSCSTLVHTIEEDHQNVRIETEYVDEMIVTVLTEDINIEEHAVETEELEAGNQKHRCRETIIIDNAKKEKLSHSVITNYMNSATPKDAYSRGHGYVTENTRSSQNVESDFDDYVIIDKERNSISSKEKSRSSIFFKCE